MNEPMNIDLATRADMKAYRYWKENKMREPLLTGRVFLVPVEGGYYETYHEHADRAWRVLRRRAVDYVQGTYIKLSQKEMSDLCGLMREQGNLLQIAAEGDVNPPDLPDACPNPECTDKTNVRYGTFVADESKFFQPVLCASCGTEWNDVYARAGVEDVRIPEGKKKEKRYHRPSTRGELVDKLREGVACEIVDSNVSTTNLLIEGHLDPPRYTVRTSENKGWAVYERVEEEDNDD
jgi:hypothetical protein